MLILSLRNESTRKQLYRRDVLTHLAERILAGENVDEEVEISVLLCDDAMIKALNRQYRKINKATDVLSFTQESFPAPGLRLLGDIVISLETVERFCNGDRAAMRHEIRLLFCHGLLHLLGHDHDTKRKQAVMVHKQAAYLETDISNAWHGADGNK